MHCGHVESAAGSNRWAYTFSSDLFLNSRRQRRKARFRFEVAFQSVLHEKVSCTIAARGLLGGGLVTVRQMRALGVANVMGGFGGNCFSQFVSGLVDEYASGSIAFSSS